MAKSPTTDNHTQAGDSDDFGRPPGVSDRVGRPWGLATYYRLRSIALQIRVRALEAELDRMEQQYQQTVARYEKLLQRPDEDWVVVTNDTPAEAPAVTED